jgi:UPF0755 protein
MKKLISYLFLFAFIFGAFIAYTIFSKVLSSVVDKETTIFIHQDDSYEDLLQNLKDESIVKDEKVFDLLATKMNLKNKIRPGKYVFQEGTNAMDLIRDLRNGKQTAIKLVINNVNFKSDLAGKVAKQIDIDSLSFLNFLNDEKELKKLGFDKDNIMCQFIPNTYQVYWSTGQEAFIKKMIKEHSSFWNNARKTKAKALKLREEEVFILASIVEKEYKFADERNRIAGVYLNRIKINMPLQADPTCKFAWGDLSLKRVLNIHTQNPHPYNTYYINGLPPGPICLPETSTIDAVLNAEKHKYLYFCAHSNLDGRHEFNTNLSAHNASARKYQAALNKLKIYK